MMEEPEPFYHVLETGCSAAFSASLDRISPNSPENPDCSFYGSEHETALSPQSPQLGRSVPALSSPEENEMAVETIIKQEDVEEQVEKGTKHSSQSSVYYAQIIYEEYEKMKRDSPAENGTCRRVPLMINPVPSSKSKQKHSSSGGSNTSVHTSGSNSSLRVFKRAPLTGTYSDSTENGGGVHSSPPNSGGSSADQNELSGGSLNNSGMPPQAIRTLPAPHHRPYKSHTSFGHSTFAGIHQQSNFHPEFLTISSRPVLPPPPPPPVPPFNHIPSASMVVEGSAQQSPRSFAHHPRTHSFTLRDRPLPERPDNSTFSLHRNRPAYIPRSVTPEPSRRKSRKPETESSDLDHGAKQFKTLPHNRKVNRENCMNLDWNAESNRSTPAHSNRKSSVPNDKVLLNNLEKSLNGDRRSLEESKMQPQTPSKLSSTFSTLKKLLKRDKTPSRTDGRSLSNKSASQSPSVPRGHLTLSVFRTKNFESDDSSLPDELAYDIQSLHMETKRGNDYMSSGSQVGSIKANSFRDSSKPLYIPTPSGSLNRTQSLVDMSEGSLMRSKLAPRRPVRIISFLSQASGCPSDDLSSYTSSTSPSTNTPVQYVNTLFGSPNDTSHEIIDFMSSQNSNMLSSFLSNNNPYMVSDSGDFVPLLDFAVTNHINARLCAMLLFDLLSQLTHKFYESSLTGIGPHMFYIYTSSTSNASSLTLSRPRLILRWDAPYPHSKKLIVKPEPSKVSELLSVVVYICNFRSINTSMSSIIQHVKSSVLVHSFFKNLISNDDLYKVSPSLVQCYLSCFLGWLPSTFSNLFIQCSKAVPSCRCDPYSTGAKKSEQNSPDTPIYNQQLTISTAQLWLRLEKSKLTNQIFSKVLSQSLSANCADALTPTPPDTENSTYSDFLLDELHDRASIINSCNACDLSATIKFWTSAHVDKGQQNML